MASCTSHSPTYSLEIHHSHLRCFFASLQVSKSHEDPNAVEREKPSHSVLFIWKPIVKQSRQMGRWCDFDLRLPDSKHWREDKFLSCYTNHHDSDSSSSFVPTPTIYPCSYWVFSSAITTKKHRWAGSALDSWYPESQWEPMPLT